MTRRTPLILLTVFSSLATAAHAQIPDHDLSVATISVQGAGVFTCIAGIHGDPLTAARIPNTAGTVDATITLTLVDYLGDPVAGYPRQRMPQDPCADLSVGFPPVGSRRNVTSVTFVARATASRVSRRAGSFSPSPRARPREPEAPSRRPDLRVA